MTKFGKPLHTPPKAKGKGLGHAMLPNRAAVAQLTKGDPVQQSMGNYSKLDPVGAGAPTTYGGIMDEGQAGVSLKDQY
jgi:hypothetical protein